MKPRSVRALAPNDSNSASVIPSGSYARRKSGIRSYRSSDQGGVDGHVHPRDGHDPALVEADLPGVRERVADLAADQLGPVEPVPVRGRQEPRAVTALAEDRVGPLECGDPGPVGRIRVDREVVT